LVAVSDALLERERRSLIERVAQLEQRAAARSHGESGLTAHTPETPHR
jgi:hypothetical protein